VLISRSSVFHQHTALIFHLVALLETLHSTGGVKYAPLPGVERVALAAYLDLEFLSSRARGESMAARAGNFGIIEIFGMNFFFHSG
jgi:hypothetical protein